MLLNSASSRPTSSCGCTPVTLWALQVEQLWTNVAVSRRNVVPVLDFLIARGHQECNGSSAAQVAIAPGCRRSFDIPRVQAAATVKLLLLLL